MSLIEQGERETTRLHTARKLAVALSVPTSVLSRGDAEDADPGTQVSWEPVRQALVSPAGQHSAASAVAKAARSVLNPGDGSGGCCDPSYRGTSPEALDESEWSGASMYAPGETDGLPEEAVLASLGCGNPLAVADRRRHASRR